MVDVRLIRTAGAGEEADRGPEIVTSYSSYQPPFDVSKVVGRMVDSVPPAYLKGLERIVLTNTAELTRKRRRAVTTSRKRKVRVVEARGLYHPEWHRTPAWIEIFVDNTLKEHDKSFLLKLPLVREFEIGGVLFHEIGHHIHFTSRPEFREREDVADVWKVRLEGIYLRRRYSWLRIFVRPLYRLFRPLFQRKDLEMARQMLQKGVISRAEFEERTKPVPWNDSGPAKQAGPDESSSVRISAFPGRWLALIRLRR